MLHAGRVVLDLDVRHRVGPAFVADQQAVALGIVARFLGFRVHGDQPPVGVLRPARADPLGDDARLGALAKVDHLGAGIGLLHVVGDGDGVELALAIVAPQDAGRILPRHGGPGFDLRPHHLGPVAPAIGAFGHEVVDAALAVLIARIPVLHGGILHLRVFLDDDLDHRRVQLRGIALRRRAAFKVADVGPLVRDDQRAFELAGVLRVDAEVRGQFHRAAYARRHVDERPVRKDGGVQRGIEIVGHRYDGAEVFLHQIGVFPDRLRDRAEDDPGLLQLILEGRAHRHGIEHRVHGDLAAFGGGILGALDAGEDHLFFKRDTQLFVGGQ